MPIVVALDDDRAADPAIVGAKAANVARAATAGLPTLPGFALTVEGSRRGLDDLEVVESLRAARSNAGGERSPFVVRSSSTLEDAASSSMAGQFTSVLDVATWEQFLDATAKVLASADAVRDRGGEARPMGVLVQRQLDAALGGVLFGVDPVTGSVDHVTVDVVPTRPDALVSGTVTAAHYVLDRRGRIVSSARVQAAPTLPLSLRRRLVRLARRAAEAFGGPQDIEWALDRDGALWLLQARPVTAVASPVGTGPIMGPGPVAETFPAPLHELEQALWLSPLRRGIHDAIHLTGAVAERRLRHSPIVQAVDGRAAADLDLLGVHARRGRRLSPSSVLRRLRVAWRVGQLRVDLPSQCAALVDDIDTWLSGIPGLWHLDDAELLDILRDAGPRLEEAHRLEVLAGMLLPQSTGPSVAAVGLSALHRTRARAGDRVDDIVVDAPEVLALAPPAIGVPYLLPVADGTSDSGPSDSGPSVEQLGPRDAMRLRTRWLQELTARIADEVGHRLAARGALPTASAVCALDLDDLRRLLVGGVAPPDLAARLARRPGAPLPEAFRLDADGHPVPEAAMEDRRDGVAASAGRAVGPVRHALGPRGDDTGDGDAKPILVVAHLEPGLAAVLGRVAGLVSETGSPLSHLAILAREMHVPTVVGVHDARARFAPGTVLLVDGSSGEVRSVGDGAPPSNDRVALEGSAT